MVSKYYLIVGRGNVLSWRNVFCYHVSCFNDDNLVFVRKGVNDKLSKEVLNHSYEDMKFNEKSSRLGKSTRYYFKYKVFYKIYTFFFMILNMLKRLLLLRF